jgi:hypothetical protein
MARMVPVPDYGELMPLANFRKACDEGWLISYDGSGHYATAHEMDRDSDVWDGSSAPEWATHVAWFNR